MTSSTTKLETQAIKVFHALLTEIVRPRLQEIQDIVENATSEEDAFKKLGIPDDKAKAGGVAMIAGLMSFGPISAFLEAATEPVHPSKLDSLGANARPATLIEITQPAEGALASLYERMDHAILDEVLDQPGMVEAFENQRSVLRLNHFEDGSLISERLSGGSANQAIVQKIMEKATSIDQVAKPKEAQKIKDLFNQALEHILNEPGLSVDQATRNELTNLANEHALKTIVNLAGRDTLMVGYSSLQEASLGLMDNITEPKGGWKNQIEVSVDGVPCHDLAAFNLAIGCPPPLGLDGALARLRASRTSETSDSEASVTTGSRAKLGSS